MENDRGQSGRQAGHRIQPDVHDLEAGPCPPKSGPGVISPGNYPRPNFSKKLRPAPISSNSDAAAWSASTRLAQARNLSRSWEVLAGFEAYPRAPWAAFVSSAPFFNLRRTRASVNAGLPAPI